MLPDIVPLTFFDVCCSHDGPCSLLLKYIDIWKTKSALCCVSSFDLLILSTVIANPMREDCLRRGWEEDRAVPFCLLPVIGPALYLLLRPSLEE